MGHSTSICVSNMLNHVVVSELNLFFELPSGQAVTALSLAWIYFHLPDYFLKDFTQFYVPLNVPYTYSYTGHMFICKSRPTLFRGAKLAI